MNCEKTLMFCPEHHRANTLIHSSTETTAAAAASQPSLLDEQGTLQTLARAQPYAPSAGAYKKLHGEIASRGLAQLFQSLDDFRSLQLGRPRASPKSETTRLARSCSCWGPGGDVYTADLREGNTTPGRDVCTAQPDQTVPTHRPNANRRSHQTPPTTLCMPGWQSS